MTKDPSLYVLDTSVILTVALQQKGHERAEKLLFLKDTYKISVLLPEIFRFEFFNILGREIGKEGAMEAYKVFMERQVSFVPFEGDLAESALRLMKKYPKISFYDAAFHALAKAYDTYFITMDEKYFAMTKKEGHVKLLGDLEE